MNLSRNNAYAYYYGFTYFTMGKVVSAVCNVRLGLM